MVSMSEIEKYSKVETFIQCKKNYSTVNFKWRVNIATKTNIAQILNEAGLVTFAKMHNILSNYLDHLVKLCTYRVFSEVLPPLMFFRLFQPKRFLWTLRSSKLKKTFSSYIFHTFLAIYRTNLIIFLWLIPTNAS